MSRENNFALLHYVGAFLVLIGHFFNLYYGNTINMPFFLGSQMHGLGVEFLFIISGFLVSQSLLLKNKKAHKYIIERFVRLFPPLIVCLLVTVLAGWIITTENSQVFWASAGTYLWKNSLMFIHDRLAGCFASVPFPNAVNGSLWTLPIELASYLILPFVIYPFKKCKSKIPMFVVCLTLTIVLYVFGVIFEIHPEAYAAFWGTDWTKALRLAYFFFAGTTLAMVINFVESSKKFFNVIVAIMLVFISAFFQRFYIFSIVLRYVFLPYFVISIALAKPLFHNFFNNHDYVYGLYLYSFPITQLTIFVSMKCGNNFTNRFVEFFLLILVILLAILFGFLSSRFVEKPVNKLYKIITQKVSKAN